MTLRNVRIVCRAEQSGAFVVLHPAVLTVDGRPIKFRTCSVDLRKGEPPIVRIECVAEGLEIEVQTPDEPGEAKPFGVVVGADGSVSFCD